MDNAMVKRGIGAVVLAVVAAVLLGYLLKDKSRARQDAIEIKIPDAPSLSNTGQSITEGIRNTSATIVNETSEAVSNTSNAVVASASNGLNSISNGVKNTFDTVSEGVSSAKASVNTNSTGTINNVDESNPGFSFRPPTENEEQQINTDSSIKIDNTVGSNDSDVVSQNNSVVASSNTTKKEVKTFKPRIEKEKKIVKKKKKPATKTVVNTAANTAGGKYSIQLLATSSQSRASKLAQTFKNEGYVSYITQTTSNNKILYRVRVGGHKDRNTAMEAQKSMQRRYQKNFFVQNSLVVSKK